MQTREPIWDGDSGKEALIRDQLRRILASPGFVHSARMRQFLEVIVENSFSGDGPLKEIVIGVRVFERAPDYDSNVEPIVRVEARRLRQKLQQYYEREGAADPVVITLPKGGYTPGFEIRTVGSVEPPPTSAPPPAAERQLIVPPVPVERSAGRVRYVWRMVAAGCCLAAVAIGISWSLGTGWNRPARNQTTQAVSDSRPIRSISVLPLSNLSGDPAQDYLADGMTDELTGSLARIASLRVISRTSAMRYKGVSKPLPEIAKELNVDAVVEGSVTRAGSRVRITAQLIDGKTDRHLWAEDYNRPADNLLAVEGEVARDIAKQVARTVTGNELPQGRAGADIPPEAYDAYLKGRYFWNKRSEDGLRTSIRFFQQALASAPSYAEAWAGLADSYLLLGENWERPSTGWFAKARDAADRALKLDDDSGEAHATRAALEADTGHWDRAEPEFRRAVQLSPGYATAHQWYAEGLAAHGRANEALEEIRRAHELDPLSLIVNVQVGYINYLARRYDEAVAWFRAAIQMDPQFFFAHADLGQVYMQKGMYPEAIAELRKAAELSNQAPAQMLWLALARALAGRKEEALRDLTALEISFAHGLVPASSMALLDVALGDRERAMRRLESACAAHVAQQVAGPEFDVLRADPRISAVLAGCGTGG